LIPKAAKQVDAEARATHFGLHAVTSSGDSESSRKVEPVRTRDGRVADLGARPNHNAPFFSSGCLRSYVRVVCWNLVYRGAISLAPSATDRGLWPRTGPYSGCQSPGPEVGARRCPAAGRGGADRMHIRHSLPSSPEYDWHTHLRPSWPK